MGGQPTGAMCWKNSSLPGSLEISTANGSFAFVITATVHIQLLAGSRPGLETSCDLWCFFCIIKLPTSSALVQSVERKKYFQGTSLDGVPSSCDLKQTSPPKKDYWTPSTCSNTFKTRFLNSSESPEPRTVKKLNGMLSYSLYLKKWWV